MDENFKPDTSRGAHIVEIKEKKQKTAFPVRAFIIILTVSVIVSALSGAGGALFMFGYLRNISPYEETTSSNEFVIEEESTAFVGAESVTSENQTVTVQGTYESETFLPPVEESTAYIPPAEETTAAVPALSKGEIYSEAVNSIVAIKSVYQKKTVTWIGTYTETLSNTGTGFAVTDNGYIVTNNHVVENAETLTVTDYDGKEYKAKIVGTVPENDFAVIKINADTTPVELGYSASLAVGDDIMVIGNALGELSYTFTDGIVSHLSRALDVGDNKIINMFQTNAAINNGNSGGPVYNMDGEVVGIASAKLASEAVEGLGFCIPIDDVRDMMSDIILFGYVTGKPLLGVTLQTVTYAMASRYSIPTGCYIVALDNDSPCYKAGIRSGDVITKLAGKTVSGCEDVENILSKKSAGDSITVTCTREGVSETYSVILDEKKPADPRTDYSNVFDY